jgi:hypothetical protein
LYAPSIRKWQDWSFAVGLLNARYVSGQGQEVACVEDFYYNYRIHGSPGRISAQYVSESDMVKETIRLYPEIFRHHYPEVPEAALADAVMASKPDRLDDLLQIARYDPALAQSVRTIRNYALTSNVGDCGVW